MFPLNRNFYALRLFALRNLKLEFFLKWSAIWFFEILISILKLPDDNNFRKFDSLFGGTSFRFWQSDEAKICRRSCLFNWFLKLLYPLFAFSDILHFICFRCTRHKLSYFLELMLVTRSIFFERACVDRILSLAKNCSWPTLGLSCDCRYCVLLLIRQHRCVRLRFGRFRINSLQF